MKRATPIVLCVLLSACFSESGLTDEFQDATNAIDDLVDAIADEGPVRDAVARVRDTVDEADAALEAYRENPNAETRQALEDAEQRMSDAGGARGAGGQLNPSVTRSGPSSTVWRTSATTSRASSRTDPFSPVRTRVSERSTTSR